MCSPTERRWGGQSAGLDLLRLSRAAGSFGMLWADGGGISPLTTPQPITVPSSMATPAGAATASSPGTMVHAVESPTIRMRATIRWLARGPTPSNDRTSCWVGVGQLASVVRPARPGTAIVPVPCRWSSTVASVKLEAMRHPPRARLAQRLERRYRLWRIGFSATGK